MKNPTLSIFALVCLAAVPQVVHSAVIADFTFAVDSAGNPAVDGAAVGDTLHNDGSLPSGNNRVGNPVYALYTPPASGIGSNGDGFAVRTGPNNGNGSFWFNAADQNSPGIAEGLNTNSTFSVFTRVRFNTLDGFRNIAGRPSGQGYSVFVRDTGKLDFYLSGMGDIFNDHPDAPTLETDTWYDIGYSFDGIGNDGVEDTLKLYFNGENILTHVGSSTMENGDFFHFGATGGGDQTVDGLYDRVTFYDNVLTDADFRALSVPEPSVLLFSSAGLIGLAAWRRR